MPTRTAANDSGPLRSASLPELHSLATSNQLPEHQAFVAVVHTSSFSEAARVLGVTKSCISKQIGRLEERLGVRLLQRSTRSLHLTEAGDAFHQRCLHILRELHAAEEMAAQLHNTPTGTLRLAAPAMFGGRFIAPITYDFLKQHPQLNVELTYTNEGVDIVGCGFDLSIHIGDLPDSTLVARRLCATRSYVCAHPRLLQEHGTPLHPRDLRNLPCLDAAAADPCLAWRFSGPDGELRLKLDARVGCNHLDALLEACRQGLGFAMLPDYIAQELLQRGELHAVLTSWTAAETPVWLVYPHTDLSAKARLFIDFLVARLELPHLRELPADPPYNGVRSKPTHPHTFSLDTSGARP